jgi:predicted dehydrogenase
VRPELVAVCDVHAASLDWFRQVPTVKHFDLDHRVLLARPEIDVVYVAVPHHLHEPIYLDVLRAGKDLFAEKPFGIDLPAARRIRDEGKRLGRFVRVSSEFPFLPGAQRGVPAGAIRGARPPARGPQCVFAFERSRSGQSDQLETPVEVLR